MKAVNNNAKKGRITKFHGVMRSLNNRYVAKSRLYSVSFKKLNISNVNFKGAIITKSSFVNSIITDCEFLGTNLSQCNFKNAIINNCIFLGTKLTSTNFNGASFKNVIFVTQRFDDSNNITFSCETNKIIKHIEKVELSEELKKQIDRYHEVSKDKLTHILKFNTLKYNFLHISILLDTFTQEQLRYALKKIIDNKIFDIPTIFALKRACKSQLKMLL